MRHARLLELRREVSGEHTANESPESVADDDRADPAVGFAQRNQAPDAEAYSRMAGGSSARASRRPAPCSSWASSSSSSSAHWWRRKARRPSRVGPCASSQEGLAVAKGMALRARAAVLLLAVGRRRRAVASLRSGKRFGS